MAVSFQNGLLEMASTTRPTARSLSATQAFGVGEPTFVPAVWSLGKRTNAKAGNCSPLPVFCAAHRCRDIFSGLDLAPLALGRASGRRTSGGWRVFLLKLLAPNGLDVLAVVPVGHFVLR